MLKLEDRGKPLSVADQTNGGTADIGTDSGLVYRCMSGFPPVMRKQFGNTGQNEIHASESLVIGKCVRVGQESGQESCSLQRSDVGSHVTLPL